MARLIRVDGRQEPYTVPSEPHDCLLALQYVVGGRVDVIDIGEEVMICCEDGKTRDLPLNLVATEIARRYLPPDDWGVVGDVIVAAPEAVEALFEGLWESAQRQDAWHGDG